MPRKKTVTPDEQPMEAMTAAETGGEENAGLFPEGAPDMEGAGTGLPPDAPTGEALPGDMPGGETPSSEDGVPAGAEPPADPPFGDDFPRRREPLS